jgi:HD superfamily phosphohydrolase
MNVVEDVLVIEEKGIYSVEKFLMSRRLMYWQAYLHKTSLVAELILTKILKRAKELTLKGIHLPCSEPLLFFLQNKITLDLFDAETLDLFSQLDDFDIISALKSWQKQDDFILSSLSKMIVNRDLLKIKLTSEKVATEELLPLKERFASENNITLSETNYFIFKGKIKNQAYSKEAEPIRILMKDRTIEDVVEASDQLNLKSLSKLVTKYYICFPKQLLLN